MPENNSPMQGMMPAFMNTPQYQQQMQSLAMQLRQQEDGIKRTKKFLKAYEDIQLNQPIPQQQPAFMQPPGGMVQAQNQQLAASVAPEAGEQAPTSFTQLAGGMGGQQGMEGDAGPAGTPGPTPEEPTQGQHPEWNGGFKLGPAGEPSTKRDTSEDKVPLDQRGDFDASRPSRQQERKKINQEEAYYGKGVAMGKIENDAQSNRLNIIDLERRIQYLEKDIKKGSSTTIETDPRTGKTYPIGGYSEKQIEEKKTQISQAKDAIAKAKKQIEIANKKYKLASKSTPNKAMGLGLSATIGGALMSDAYAADAAQNSPEMAAGRNVDQGSPGRNDNPRTAAAHQAYLEQQAKTGNYMVNRKPGSRGQQPIEYSAAEDVRAAQ
jgi:hypothetical protein